LKIGVFGGTFDPVHIGHLRSALETLELLDLDEIWFIPAAFPPHKDQTTFASFEHRLNMLKLATKHLDFFRVLDVEADRPGPSFTIDTIHELRRDAPDGAEFFLMMGLDQFISLKTWKDYKQLPVFSSIVVMERQISEEIDIFQQISEIFPEMIWSEDEAAFVAPGLKSIYPLAVTPLDISSSAIRDMLAVNASISFLTPEPVIEYLLENSLYLPEKTEEEADSGLDIAFEVMELLNKSNAKDVIGLDLRRLSDVTDFFIIAAGRSSRQNQGIADELEAELKKLGIRPRTIEATKESNWILMDYGDWVVHIFQEEAREFYDLEGLWHDAPRLTIARGHKSS